MMILLKDDEVKHNSSINGLSADKYENANCCWHFRIFSRENFMLSCVKHENNNNLGTWTASL